MTPGDGIAPWKHCDGCAPEVVFGDKGFSRPVDAWSLGIVLCLTAGVRNPNLYSLGGNSEVGYMIFLAQWLGTPTGFEHLPHWPKRGRPGAGFVQLAYFLSYNAASALARRTAGSGESISDSAQGHRVGVADYA